MSQPSPASRKATREPMKPAPPVMSSRRFILPDRGPPGPPSSSVAWPSRPTCSLSSVVSWPGGPRTGKTNDAILHLSVDDVFAGLVTASDHGRALAADKTIGALDRLHAEFGTNVDLYLFAESELDGQQRRLEVLST